MVDRSTRSLNENAVQVLPFQICPLMMPAVSTPTAMISLRVGASTIRSCAHSPVVWELAVEPNPLPVHCANTGVVLLLAQMPMPLAAATWALNSDVLLDGSVAVAVMYSPAATDAVKVAVKLTV